MRPSGCTTCTCSSGAAATSDSGSGAFKPDDTSTPEPSEPRSTRTPSSAGALPLEGTNATPEPEEDILPAGGVEREKRPEPVVQGRSLWKAEACDCPEALKPRRAVMGRSPREDVPKHTPGAPREGAGEE